MQVEHIADRLKLILKDCRSLCNCKQGENCSHCVDYSDFKALKKRLTEFIDELENEQNG